MVPPPLQLAVVLLAVILIGLPGASISCALGQENPVRSKAIPQQWSNLGFEEGVVSQVPTGWLSPTAPAFAAELIEDQPKSGKRCALLHSTSTPTEGLPFGNLMQAVDATPFRGRRVRFRAAVRTEAGARAQLWMRVDRQNNQMGFFDNMQDRPIISGEWAYYEIVGDVDQDAAVINIGMMLFKSGKAWLDDVSFDDLGKLVVPAEPARPLTARGLDNLIAFTRLLGYVRHFHPSDQAAATDWDTFTIEALKDVETAKDAGDLAQKLETVFKPIAPTVRVFVTGSRPPLPSELVPPRNAASLRIVSWKHKGFGQKSAQGNIYSSKRITTEATGELPANTPDPQKPFSADLGGGVSSLVPLALFADAGGTLPHVVAKATDSPPVFFKYSGNDRTTRLADVALAWNILEHFYPYFDVVHTDWPRALRIALTDAASDRDEHAFVMTLRRMIAKLEDGHGWVRDPGESFQFTYPVRLAWIEDHLVITDVASNGAEGLQPGDVVLKIDSRPSVEVIAETEETMSAATPQWRRNQAISQLLMQNSEITLEVKTQAGETKSVTLHRNVEMQSLREMRPPKVSELKPGIFYLDLDRIKDDDFQAALPKLEKARGIIFDLRGYPRVSPVIISHLTEKPVESSRWLVPMITTPDHANMVEYSTDGRWKLEPIAPRLTAKIAFLTDGRAISYAESYLAIIEAYKLAEIVGEPTAGTNGNVNPFTLPGNYMVVWTGMKVLKHDGSRLHGVGIQPTVLVHRTIRGVAKRQDEQLERAMELVSK